MWTTLALCLALQQEEGCGFDPEAMAQEQEEPDERRQEAPTHPDELARPASWTSEWFPTTVLYRNYLADPLTPRSGTKVMFPFRKRDNIKIENSLGSQRTIWRSIDPSERRGIDFGIEAAVISRFDINESWDLDAADYRFGFPLGYRSGRFAVKVHPWHLTSHLGDEFISRTGASAIRYHKDELALGFSFDVTDELRVYADAGWGFYIGTPNKRRRLEAGVEWAGDILWRGPPRTFIAFDIKWREETDWDWAFAVQGGFWLVQESDRSATALRVLVEYYRGKSAQTQFPEERDNYWAVGVAAGF